MKMTLMQVYGDWTVSHMTVALQGQRSFIRNRTVIHSNISVQEEKRENVIVLKCLLGVW